MDIGWVASNYYKILYLHYLFSTLLLYMQLIVFILFYYIFASNYLLHSYNLNLQKETITYSSPSKVITIGWINFFFFFNKNIKMRVIIKSVISLKKEKKIMKNT